MYTNALLLIVGIAGFILCEVLSLFFFRNFNRIQIIAALFGWTALTGIVLSITKDFYPCNTPLALFIAAVTALAVVAIVILIIWGYLRIGKYIRTRFN